MKTVTMTVVGPACTLIIMALSTSDVLAQVGQLTQLPYPHGCISNFATTGCWGLDGVGGGVGVAVSPNGEHVYLAAVNGSKDEPGGSDSDGRLVVFERQDEGALLRIACYSELPIADCTVVTDGLAGAREVDISPDGKHIYVALGQGRGAGGVSVFARDRRTGLLQHLQCITATATDTCASAPGLANALQATVSPDGHFVFVAALKGEGDGALVVFRRNRQTGLLTWLECFNEKPISACSLAPGLGGARGVAVSHDGMGVYVASLLSGGNGAVTAFALDASTGQLSFLSCFSEVPLGVCQFAAGVGEPTQLAVSSDDAQLYVANFTGGGGGAVATFRRDLLTAGIVPAGCISGGPLFACAYGAGLSAATGIATSADGLSVYVSSNWGDGTGAVAAFRRELSGSLTQIGCVSAGGVGRCSQGYGMETAEGMALDRRGENLYVASSNSLPRGSGGGIVTFARNRGSPDGR